jgi:uncharacterized membrane protein
VSVLAWAAILTFLAAVLFVWTPQAELQWGPFALAAAATWGIGAFVLLRRRETRAPLISVRSGGALLLAIGAALAANSLVFGWWLAAIGAALTALSLGLLARERR